MSDVTRILERIERGEAQAADELLPLVYDELRRVAHKMMAHEKPGQTLQPTALVHEAWLRLVAEPARVRSASDTASVGNRNNEGEEGDATGDSNAGHEAVGHGPSFANRRHFFGAAAEAMRRILVENARRKGRLKRGGGRQRVDLDKAEVAGPAASDQVLALDEALSRLAADDPIKARLVELRFFAGMTVDEAASALDIAPITAKRYWRYARAWLRRELSR